MLIISLSTCLYIWFLPSVKNKVTWPSQCKPESFPALPQKPPSETISRSIHPRIPAEHELFFPDLTDSYKNHGPYQKKGDNDTRVRNYQISTSSVGLWRALDYLWHVRWGWRPYPCLAHPAFSKNLSELQIISFLTIIGKRAVFRNNRS